MGSKKLIIISLLLLSCVCTWSKVVTDTLESTKRDWVIVTYDISQNNGQTTIKFHDVRKGLGRTFNDKYKKLNDIAVLFFDKIGNYGDDMEFSGIEIKAFMIPKNVRFKVSEEGYYSLKDNPKLSLELKSDDATELSIPIFLAHYESKHRYKVFSRCEDLKIKLSPKKFGNTQDGLTRKLVTQTITSQEEVGGSDANVAVASSLINRVREQLAEQEDYPFPDELKQDFSRLRELSDQIEDEKLSSKIKDVLYEYKSKEKELKAEAKAAEDATAKAAELKAKEAEAQALARQDSIAAAAQKKADENRKQNIWLIIGGVILAILAFVGNQVFQHFRNVKNQKSMMDMQQSVVKRAEMEAKRRARNMAQSQINRVQGEARRKTRGAINDGIKNIGKKAKGNKDFSI